jgi:hypothetical protein
MNGIDRRKKNAGQTRSHYLGPPEFEGFEVVLSEYAGAK